MMVLLENMYGMMCGFVVNRFCSRRRGTEIEFAHKLKCCICCCK